LEFDLQTARALDIEMPPSVLAVADEVIKPFAVRQFSVTK